MPGKDLQGLNIVEFADTDEAGTQGQGGRAVPAIDALLARGGGIIGYQVCDHLPSIETIYAMRKEVGGAARQRRGRKSRWPSPKIPPCPPESLADFIMEFRALLDAHGLDYGMFGHVDAGSCTRPALDPVRPRAGRCCCGASRIGWWPSPPNTVA